MRLVDAPETGVGYRIERTLSDRAWEGISALIDQIDNETVRGLAEITAGAPIVGYATLKGLYEDTCERVLQPGGDIEDVIKGAGAIIALPVSGMLAYTFWVGRKAHIERKKARQG